MIRSLKAAAVCSGAVILGIFLATASLSRAHADAAAGAPPSGGQNRGEAYQPPTDPKKKLPGANCKSSDECQNHHTCAKVGDKSVCQAPPQARLPPGAVT